MRNEPEYILVHSGVKGMRWGVIRWIEKRKAERAKNKQRKAAAKEKKQRAEEKKATKKLRGEYKQNVKKALENGDAEAIQKYRRFMTTRELKEANDRFREYKTLAGYASGQRKARFDKSPVGRTINGVEKAAKLADTASKALEAYNKIAKVYNAVNAGDKDMKEVKTPDKKKK